MSTVQEQTILSRLKSRGYWMVSIHPISYQKNLSISQSDLYSIIMNTSVRFRGWDFPHIDYNNNPILGMDWVGLDYCRDDEFEVWRFFQSGQFVHFFAIHGEWRDESTFWPADSNWSPGAGFYYLSSIYTFLEIFELASRLSRSPAGSAYMRVSIELHGLSGRRLVEDDFRFSLPKLYLSKQPDWKFDQTYSFVDLTTQSRDFAAQAARELFAIFGLDVSIESLKRIEDTLVRR